jgi:hypothetical protein
MGTQYQVNPDGVGGVAENLISILGEAMSDVMALESLGIAAAAFAGIGTSVAAADLKRQAELAMSLLKLMRLFQQIVSLVQRSAQDYRAADHAVAHSLGATTTA